MLEIDLLRIFKIFIYSCDVMHALAHVYVIHSQYSTNEEKLLGINIVKVLSCLNLHRCQHLRKLWSFSGNVG